MSYHADGSKLDRAIVAYLVGLMNPDIGSKDDIFPCNYQEQNSLPCTIVTAKRATPRTPIVGNYEWQVHIAIKSIALAADDESQGGNPGMNRVLIDKRVSATNDALMQTDDQATLDATAAAITTAGRALAVPVDGSPEAAQLAQNNADMADFTCLQWLDGGFERGTPEAGHFMEVLIFNAVACASAIN